MELPSHDSVQYALSVFDVDRSVAETHGLLSAFLVLGVKIEKSAWLNSLQSHKGAGEDPLKASAETVLSSVFETTGQMLREEDYAFQLLLPDDDALFEARVNAFAEWCQGFIAGLNLMNIHFKKKYTPEVDEALQDLIKFSCLAIDPSDAEGSNENEAALIELVEYARIAVMLLHAHQDMLLPTPPEKH